MSQTQNKAQKSQKDRSQKLFGPISRTYEKVNVRHIPKAGKITKSVKNIKNVTQNFYFVDKNSETNTVSQPELKFQTISTYKDGILANIRHKFFSGVSTDFSDVVDQNDQSNQCCDTQEDTRSQYDSEYPQ